MLISRRGAVATLAAAVLLKPVRGHAAGPPIRLVVPYPPGGGADLLARAFATYVGMHHGRTVIVENRGGATGSIGTTNVARSAPDGTVILQADSATMVVQPLAKQLPYTVNDFAPVARLTTNPVMIAASSKGPYKTIADVIRAAKAAPGTITCATNGILSHFHVSLERFNEVAGIELMHVPYQGTPPGVLAVLSGQVDLVVVPPAPLTDPGMSGLIHAIGAMTEERVKEFPDVPTFRDAGVDLVSTAWRGLLVPGATPAPILAEIEGWVRDAFADPAFVKQVVAIGETPAPLGTAEFNAFLDHERASMRDIVRRINPS